jgi:hypothetical protein
MEPLRILDSGAYSAWSNGAEIDIEQYAIFARKQRNFDVVVNLDVIPSSKGVPPTSVQVEQSAEKSWKNYQYLTRRGLYVMPVYHQGEGEKWLLRMLDAGIDYIGISPANDKTASQRKVWLDNVFHFLEEYAVTHKKPLAKTHGFGITSVPLLFRYNWYSVDSVSWILHGVYGSIIMPPPDSHGSPSWNSSPLVVPVSSRRTKDPKHCDNLSFTKRQYVFDWIAEQGFTYFELQDIWNSRVRLNGLYFLGVEEHCNSVWSSTKRIRSLV